MGVRERLIAIRLAEKREQLKRLGVEIRFVKRKKTK